MKYFSSGKTLNTFAAVAKLHLAEGELNGVQNWCEFVPDIHYNELDNLNESFSELMQPIALIVDSTTIIDEQVGVNSSASDKNLFVIQDLIGIWSVAHHLSGNNHAFVLEQGWKRINRKRKDFIAIISDRVAANSVSRDEIDGGLNNVMESGCFPHSLDYVGDKFDTEDLSKFMVAVRQILLVSIEAKILFCAHDTQERDLAGYTKIRWWNECVQLFQTSNNWVETILEIAEALKADKHCKKSSENNCDMEGCNV